jgi:ribosome-binding ATPase YchF (GTP1/OBG family)
VVILCGKIEAEPRRHVDDEDRAARLVRSRSRLATLAHGLPPARLQSYLPLAKEIRAWTIPRARSPGPRRDPPTSRHPPTLALADLEQHGSEAALKAVGKMRQEGKTYVVQDGDIMHFLFNV